MISRCADRPLAAIRKSHVVAQLYEFADSTWSSDGVSVAETLLEFAPVLSRSSLRDLLKELTPNLTREQANQILEFFTFGSDSKTSGDLWIRPFVASARIVFWLCSHR